MEKKDFKYLGLMTISVSICIFFFTGCGGNSDYPVAVARGIVTCEGKAVPNAWLYFEPLKGNAEGASALVGKQGFGIANEKGEFVITTYNTDDGAVIGNHKVHVMPPKSDVVPGFKCPCEFDSKIEPILVEIKEGKNEFKFALPIRKGGIQTMTLDERDALREAQQAEQEAKANANANAKKR